MLNIGIVGVGAISQKAYLPVMRSIGNVKWYMCTRNQEVLNRESKLLGRCIPCNTIEELLQKRTVQLLLKIQELESLMSLFIL